MSIASPSEVMMTNKVGPMYDESVPEVVRTIEHTCYGVQNYLSGGRPRRGGDSPDCSLTDHLSCFLSYFLVLLFADSGRV